MNLSKKKNKPTPKYKKGDYVTSIYHNKKILHIYSDPMWCNINNCWNYAYDYNLGNMSEGYALENSLTLVKKTQ